MTSPTGDQIDEILSELRLARAEMALAKKTAADAKIAAASADKAAARTRVLAVVGIVAALISLAVAGTTWYLYEEVEETQIAVCEGTNDSRKGVHDFLTWLFEASKQANQGGDPDQIQFYDDALRSTDSQFYQRDCLNPEGDRDRKIIEFPQVPSREDLKDGVDSPPKNRP